MNTEEKQSIREKFYKEFGQRMIIKNEISGNDYNPISDWWLTLLEEEIQKAYQHGVQETKERAVKVVRENTKGNFTIDELVEAINKI